MKKFWKVSVLIIVAGIMVGDLLLDYRTQVQAHPQDTEAAELLDVNVGIAVGDLAPDFTGTTVDGQAITLSELSGKLVVVNVFASWCGPCRAETPHLVEVYNQIDRDRVEFIGLNLQETPKAVESFKDEFSIDYPLVLDEGGGITDIYRPIGLPTTWFIDQDGIIRFSFSGPMTKESLQVILEDVEAGRDPDPFAVIG
ncbi:MAG: TlpA disulfide reductase family protein [Anaerolineales bacterium]